MPLSKQTIMSTEEHACSAQEHIADGGFVTQQALMIGVAVQLLMMKRHQELPLQDSDHARQVLMECYMTAVGSMCSTWADD